MKALFPLLMGSLLALQTPGAAEAPKSPTDIVRPSQAQELEKATTRLLRHPAAIDRALVSLGIELASVDPKISRLLVYVNGLPFQHRALGLFVWNALSSKLLRTKRFELVDFRESQTAQLTIAGGSIHFSNTIETTEKLLALASRNKADAVMMAEILSSEDQLVLTLQLIRASDSMLVWTGRFPVPMGDEAPVLENRPVTIDEITTNRQGNDKAFSIYGGSLFFGMRRKSMAAGVEDGTFWMMPSLGMRGHQRINETPFWLGMDMCLSRGTLAPGNGDLVVITGMPMFSISVDPLWGGTGNILSVFAGAGPGLALGGRGFMINGAHEGILLNIPSLLELSVGVVQMPSFDVDLYPEVDYDSQARFGGTALRVMVGKNF